MRPEIPPALAERVERIYESEGYASRGEFIRDAVRRRLNEVEDESSPEFAEPITPIQEENGVEFGVDVRTDDPIVVNRYDRLLGGNAFTCGNIGSGKSVTTKTVIRRELEEHDDLRVVILDPLEGFSEFVDRLGGRRVTIGGNIGLNPLEIQPASDGVLRDDSTIDLLAGKIAEAVTFFVSYLSHRDYELDQEERGVLERAIRGAYNRCGIGRDPETHSRESPTPQTVLEVLADMARNPVSYARDDPSDAEIERLSRLAAGLIVNLHPLSADGTDANLGGQTELDIFGEERLTYLDVASRAVDSVGLLYQVLFTHVQQHAKRVDEKVLFVIDEGHYLFDAPELTFVEQAFRHSRHYDLSIQLVSQRIDELAAHPEWMPVLDNCSIVKLHRLRNFSEEIVETLGLTPDQADFVREASPGTQNDDYSEYLLNVDGEWRPVRFVVNDAEEAVLFES